MVIKYAVRKNKINADVFRKIFFSFLVNFILIGFLSVGVYSQDEGKSVLTPAQKKRQMVQEAKENINGTVWIIELKETGAGKLKSKRKTKAVDKVKKESDVLRFENYKVKLDEFKKEGFSATNYTVRIKGQNNEVVIWETMQTSTDKGVVFCRGEIRDGRMRGVISWHISDKNKKEYSFVSVDKDKEVVPSSEELIDPNQEVEEPKKEEVKKEEVKKEEIKKEVEASKKEDITKEKKKKKKKKWF